MRIETGMMGLRLELIGEVPAVLAGREEDVGGCVAGVVFVGVVFVFVLDGSVVLGVGIGGVVVVVVVLDVVAMKIPGDVVVFVAGHVEEGIPRILGRGAEEGCPRGGMGRFAEIAGAGRGEALVGMGGGCCGPAGASDGVGRGEGRRGRGSRQGQQGATAEERGFVR
jgi:hypothetical protein